PDNLLLHLAVEGDGENAVVLADVDQGILLRELGERHAERVLVGGIARAAHRLERRRREAGSGAPRGALAAEGPAPALAQAPELGDLPRSRFVATDFRPVLEHRERGDLLLVDAVTDAQRPVEEPRVRDAFVRPPALDLEDARRERAVGCAGRRWQQLSD